MSSLPPPLRLPTPTRTVAVSRKVTMWLTAGILLAAAIAVPVVVGVAIDLFESGQWSWKGVAPDALAQEAVSGKQRLPRFESLRSDKAYLRVGPGVRFPIAWVYQRRGLPVEVIEEYDTWRRVRDRDGVEGWMHSSLLQTKRQVLVHGGVRDMRRAAEDGAQVVARLEPGVIGALQRCETNWCRVEITGLSGWIRRDQIWGVYPFEAPN